jgi:hypothetical protein
MYIKLFVVRLLRATCFVVEFQMANRITINVYF